MHYSPDKKLQEIYTIFDCEDIDELFQVYLDEDQRLIYANKWDYKNPELLPNRIRAELEQVELSKIADDHERNRTQDLLWFWYHHAIGCALWQHGDTDTARAHATKALEFLREDNLNQVTKLLYLLVHKQEYQARQYAKTIKNEDEQRSAAQLLEMYDSGNFFKKRNSILND